MHEPTPRPDPVDLLRQFSAADLRKRLDDLAAEEAALKALYRSAAARERVQRFSRQAGRKAGEGRG